MIMLVSTHKAVVESIQAQIADLKEQVRFLRDLANPGSRVQLVSAEANAILDGNNEAPIDLMTAMASPSQDAIDQEASALLSGNY